MGTVWQTNYGTISGGAVVSFLSKTVCRYCEQTYRANTSGLFAYLLVTIWCYFLLKTA